MYLVFIGPPGAGKGTQADRLTRHLGIPHLSTGEMLRQAVTLGTELGKVVGPIMASSKLVSDELIVGIVRERVAMDDCRDGFLLDGFPRTTAQAADLEKIFADTERRLTAVIELHVPEEELFRRLIGRGQQTATPRADDHPDAIPKRLETYRIETEPVLGFYRERGLLEAVDGTGTMDEVFERIKTAVHARADWINADNS